MPLRSAGPGREAVAQTTASVVSLARHRAALLGLATALALAVVSLYGQTALAISAPIVANGGFETPSVQDVTYSSPDAFGGWTVDSGSIRVANSSSWSPASGTQSILFGDGDGGLSQVVTVEAGKRYRLSLSYADGPVPPPGYVSCEAVGGVVMPTQVWWGDTKVAMIYPGIGQLTDNWQHFSTLVTAAANTSKLRFTARSEPPDYPHCGMNLDDVAVSAPSAFDTATTLSSSANPSVAGQAVTVTATVISGDVGTTPTGTVQLMEDGVPVSSPATLDGAGSARFTNSALAVGSHNLAAAYNGGTSFSSSSASLTQVVGKADTVSTEAVSPDPTVAGQDATFTATVTAKPPGAGTPAGLVQFADDDGSPIGPPRPLDSTGTASIVAFAFAGNYRVHANYLGDARFSSSSAIVSQLVNKADTTMQLTSSQNPIPLGGRVTFTALVSVNPPGDVAPFGSLQFTVDGTPLGGTIPLDGAAGVQLSVTAPTVAQTNTIGVSYSGDTNTNPGSASLQQTVGAPSATAPTPAKPAAPALSTTASQLTAMTAALTRSLGQRGFAAFTNATQTLTATGPGLLDQKLYSPKAPKSAIQSKAKNILIASARHTFAAAGKGTLRLRLTAAGRRAIRHAKSLKLAIVTRFTPRGGRPVIVVKRLTVKAKRKRSAAARAATVVGWRVVSIWPKPTKGQRGSARELVRARIHRRVQGTAQVLEKRLPHRVVRKEAWIRSPK